MTITKRNNVSLRRSILVRVVAISAALIVSAVLTVIMTKDNPISIFITMIEGAFGTDINTWFTLQNLALLLLVALAVTPAFRMRFWNIGAEGQALIGGLVSAVIMFYMGGQGEASNMPEWLITIVMIVAALLAGAIWGIIPAVFKAVWNTNETLFTLMMNYVAIQLIEFFLKIADKSGSNIVGPSLLKYGRLPELFNQKYLLTIIVAVVMTVLMYTYLNYTKHGYEIAVVGESENTAKYIGINVKKVIIRTMAISGAMCGLVGLLLVGGASYSIDSKIVGGRGFTAIMVSWLAKFNPYMMVLTSFLLVFLSRGSEAVTLKFGLNSSFSEIITGVILFFIIGCEFFINYKIRVTRKEVNG